MSNATHAPAPWRHVLGHDTHAVKRDRAGRMLGTVTMPLEDYDRACACVNALAGLDPAAVAGVVLACEAFVRAYEQSQGRSDARPIGPGTTYAQARSALAALRGGGAV